MSFGMKFIRFDQKMQNGLAEPRHSYMFSGHAYQDINMVFSMLYKIDIKDKHSRTVH